MLLLYFASLSRCFAASRQFVLKVSQNCHNSASALPLLRYTLLGKYTLPVKYALSALGVIRNERRLPLVPVSSASEDVVSAALSKLSLVDSGTRR